MTSKHLFFKAMREDMRHKYWMLALSCIGNFLFIPVAWLIMRDNVYFDRYNMTPERALRYLNDGYEFYAEVLMILAGMIALAGALIVGLFGFRYVFHKNMVDTWHSLPIKRTTLFGACWLNGFLIWFIPFLVAMILSVILSGGFVLEVCSYGNISGMSAIGMICKEAAITILTLVVAFLLVYNAVLFAVMLSGNILNTLVSLGIIGFSVIGIYALGIVFFEQYMITFYGGSLIWQNVVYGSPLFSAGCLLYARAEHYGYSPVDVYDDRIWHLGPFLLNNLLIAIALGIGAWYLYQKRSSELAEQGIKNKPLIALMKLVMGVAGGMCGWLLLVALTNGADLIWGTFGCVLVSVLVFGIMDIIFHMDFKTFFKHKIQMAVTVVLAMMLCFAFSNDWFGYDSYIPDKEDIAYIAVFDNDFANRYYYGGNTEVSPLKNMQYDDVEVIYPLLERMTGITRSEREERYSYYGDRLTVKVTLKNGRTYYRYYHYISADKDVVWPLITSEEYLQQTYLFDQEDINGTYEYSIERYDDQYFAGGEIDRDKVRVLMEAYNQDVLTNPDVVLLGEGRVLAQINFRVEDSSGDNYELYLDVYDTMTNTVNAMKQVGYEKWVSEIDLTEVKELRLELGYYPDINATPEALIALARETYGHDKKADLVYTDSDTEVAEVYEIVTAEVGEEPYLSITDKDEIAEILQYCSYRSSYRNNIFSEGDVRITYTTLNDEEKRLFIKKGTLPEKYILRFGEIDLAEYGVADYYQYEYYK